MIPRTTADTEIPEGGLGEVGNLFAPQFCAVIRIAGNTAESFVLTKNT